MPQSYCEFCENGYIENFTLLNDVHEFLPVFPTIFIQFGYSSVKHMVTTISVCLFMDPCIVIIFQYISNKMQRYTVYFIRKLLYMFQVVPSPIISSSNNCIYSIWYLSHRYCYLPLSWKSWNSFGCAVGGARHPQHTQTSFNSFIIAADSNIGVPKPDAVDTVVCLPDDG